MLPCCAHGCAGIIIDTFADLRSISQAKIEDMKTVCYICNMPRHTLDRLGDGFDNHVANDHNMWAYVNYLVHIRCVRSLGVLNL